MIWFACKQCGKRHGRDDSLAGMLVFCQCGFGNRVPWMSTVAAPEKVPEAVPAERSPTSSPPPPAREESERGLPPPRRPPRLLRKVNRNYCYHHDEDPCTHTCAACSLPFCPRCVVTMQGETLCGPCKNFRIRGLGRISRLSPLAIVALVLALVSGPVILILSIMALGMYVTPEGSTAASVFLCVLGMVLPVASLFLGIAALREIERSPQLGGRALALTGTMASLGGLVWGMSLACLMLWKRYLLS